MHPKKFTITIQDWINKEEDKKHSLAVRYIEENVDLIDTDLQQFMDNCPKSFQLEVCSMLLKAGIDMKDYLFKECLNKWVYMHDANPYLSQCYTIDYEEEIDNYIKETLTQKLPEGTLQVFYS